MTKKLLKHIPALVSNAIWVDTMLLTRSQVHWFIRKSLVVGETKYDGSGEHERSTHIEKGKYLGLPRGFFHEYFNQEVSVTDQEIKWPRFRFPKGWDWRDGQEETVNAALEYFEGKEYSDARIHAECGAGKTLMALYIASQLRRRALILVHKEDLARNFHKDAKIFFPGIKGGHCQQDSWVFKNCPFVTCTFQTLYSREGRWPKGFFKRFGTVVTDEAHRVSSETFEQVIKKFTAQYRLGVSATWRRRDGLDKVFDAHLGPIVHSATTQTLGVVYRCPGVPFRPHIKNPRHWAYIVNGVAYNEDYQNWLTKEVVKCVLSNRTPLIIADRIKMLKDLKSKIRKALKAEGYPDKKIMLYIGESSKSQKKRATVSADVILGSYGIFNEGTDVPRLDTLFLATPRSDIEQCAGRIRRIKDGKKQPLIIDPWFSNCRNPILRGSAFARRNWYRKLGFQEFKK